MIRITVVGVNAERRILVHDADLVRIGRAPSNDVVLADAHVSSHHGQLRAQGGRLVYEDLITTNGSFVRRAGRIVRVGADVGHVLAIEPDDQILVGDSAHPIVLIADLVGEGSTVLARVAEFPDRGAVRELDATHDGTVGNLSAALDREALLALHRLGARVSAHLDLNALMAALADALLEAFRKANHVSIHLLDEARGEFRPTFARSRDGARAAHALSRTVRDRVLSLGKALVFQETDEGFDASESLHSSRVRSGLCAPLWDGRSVIGLVQVDWRGSHVQDAFRAGDLAVLVVFAHQAAMAIENARLHARLQGTVEQSIRGLVNALEAKDPYTAGHSEAVATLCEALARRLAIPHEAVTTVRRAALLHDIGKIGVSHDVLNKGGALTPEEFRQLKSHVELGARILEPFDFLADLVPIVLHHHERWDGRGYPAGLAGTDIPLGARILALADTYHSLVSDRAYRRSVGVDVALGEIRKCAGTQFDPALATVLESVVLDSSDGEAAPVAHAG